MRQGVDHVVDWLLAPLLTETPAGRLGLAVILTAWLYCGYLYGRKLFTTNGKLRAMAQRLSKTDEIKTYGGGAKQAQRLDKPYPFRVEGLRFDDEESHDFIATRKADTMLAMRFMTLNDDQAAELLKLAGKLIAKTLDNTDGVPVQWEAAQLPKPANAGPDWEPKFRGPDGKLHPMNQRAKFEEFAKGSSRRRWEELLVDSEFTTQLETLVEVAKDLIEMTVEVPTDG
jgi:hypothetical protein